MHDILFFLFFDQTIFIESYLMSLLFIYNTPYPNPHQILITFYIYNFQYYYYYYYYYNDDFIGIYFLGLARASQAK